MVESVTLERGTKPGCDSPTSPNVESTREGFSCARHAKYGWVHRRRLRCEDHNKYDDADNAESKTAGFCLLPAQSQHGSVSARSCLQRGCSKQPVLDLHGGGKGVLCAQHTIDRSAKVSVRRCPERGCSKHRHSPLP